MTHRCEMTQGRRIRYKKQEGKPSRRANGGKAKTSYVWFRWVIRCLKDPVRPLNRAIRPRWVRQGCNVGSSEAKAQMKACISQGLVCALRSLAKDLVHSRQGRVLTCLSNFPMRWRRNSWGYLRWVDWEIRRNAFFGERGKVSTRWMKIVEIVRMADNLKSSGKGNH